ncbi:MAG: queuosine precursor transporter [Calditrichaeota bacterium]|nr:queuosine precursor transporter [Calditrichota bacterium]
MLQAPQEAHNRLEAAYIYLLSGFIASLVISQVLAAKIVLMRLPLAGDLIFPAGVVAYAATFLFTDLIEEVWGVAKAQRAVLAGFIGTVTALILIQLAMLLPTAPFWDNAEGWAKTVGATTRITLASLVAYLISQTHDVWLFQLLKRKTDGRHLWLRNNVSTMASQFIDTTLFVTVAFLGTAPILSMIVGLTVVKWILAIFDTPFVYLGVRYLRRIELL